MTRNGIAYRPLILVRRMNGTGSGLLPTPAAKANMEAPSMQKWRRHRNLPFAQLMPTPTKSDGTGGPGILEKRTGGLNLRTYLRLKAEESSSQAPWGLADGLPGLSDAPRWNPTNANAARLSIRKSIRSNSREECSSSERDASSHGNPTGANSKPPIGATIPWSERSTWPNEVALCGVDDGIPHRMDRVRCLGNSLIPQIPEMIGRTIMAHTARS